MPDEHLEKTKQKLKERGFTTLARAPRSGVYLFFSFDLVNSTQFKVTHPNSWPVIVTRFYDLVAAEMSTRFTSAILWKYVGDEALYYQRIRSRSDVHRLLPAVAAALNSVVASLHQLDSQTRPILSVKGTVWIAEAEYLPPAPANQSSLSKRNMITSVSRLPESTDRDFLGPDIDTGFRIAKFVERKRLIVSAHLAGVLYRERAKCDQIDKRLKIVSYEILKGVWSGRRYPIVWYEDDWQQINRSFLYDEHFSSPLIAKLRSEKLDSAEHALENIENVFSDLGREGELDELLAALDESEPDIEDALVEIEIPQSKYSEVHCVAVCFSSSDRVLVGRRPSTKKRYANCWEFGCGQLQLGDTFSDCLAESYREDFGADLEVPAHPIPVATFSIDDPSERRSIPGIIFVAGIKNPDEVEGRFLKEKHSEIKWVDPNNLGLSPEECVPDLAETIRKAHSVWIRRIRNEE